MTKADARTLFRRRGWVVSAAQAKAAGIDRGRLAGLVRAGRVERIARGLYRWAEPNITEHHSLALAARSVRGGVVCLLSALQFHGLTTQLPHEVWLAIDCRRGGPPRRRVVPMRLFRLSGACFSSGIERYRIEGVTVRVYSVAKTIADCFKLRSKVGLDVAMEALREGWRGRRFTMDELWRYAEVCRVARVMRPYVEMEVS
ncbi:transcriptional regulator [candidate division WOR-3 bacterium]|nr:transcriptional regulator [candidate division WOR-3 bacterium]